MFKTTWRKLLKEALNNNKETWSDIESITLTKKQLDTEFDCDFGISEGSAFTCWTANYVYFPAVYDGREWIASVPRNPNGVQTKHIGGE